MSYTVLSSLLSDISYTLTLDADLQASHVTSRGLFTKNNERFLTERAKISSTPLCRDFQVYVQVRDENHPLCFLMINLCAIIKGHQWLFSSYFVFVFPKYFMWFLQQEAPDFVNSLSLKVEIEQTNADVNPVLDLFSLSAWEFFVSDWFTTWYLWIFAFGLYMYLQETHNVTEVVIL